MERQINSLSRFDAPITLARPTPRWSSARHLCVETRSGRIRIHLLHDARVTISACMPRLCGSGERCTIIGSEFLNAFACKLVLDIKGFPGPPQVKLLVWNRLAGSLVLKLTVGHREIPVRPQLQDCRRHGDKLRFERKTIKEVFQAADASG